MVLKVKRAGRKDHILFYRVKQLKDITKRKEPEDFGITTKGSRCSLVDSVRVRGTKKCGKRSTASEMYAILEKSQETWFNSCLLGV